MLKSVTKQVRNLIRHTRARWLIDRMALRKWERTGRPPPPPYIIKRKAIVDLARAHHCKALIETGTLMGDTMYALRNDFRQLVSIELDPTLHARAERTLGRRFPQIRFVRGDSGEKLAAVSREFNEPIAFFLDGHYSGPGTGRGSLDSPIWKEMEAVFSHPIRDHVILIDDAREFVGQGGYPTVDELRDWVKQRRPEWVFGVEHDIIRIHPPARS